MMPPIEKTAEIPQRSPTPLWGTAHLAWGVAIFVAMLFAAQRLPVDSTDWLKQLATVFFGLSLAYIALCGYQTIERGWRLRRPQATSLRLAITDLGADALLAVAMLAALMRGEQSHLLTAGLDRVVATLAVISLVMLTFSVLAWFSLRSFSGTESNDRRLTWVRLLLSVAVASLAAFIELSTL